MDGALDTRWLLIIAASPQQSAWEVASPHQPSQPFFPPPSEGIWEECALNFKAWGLIVFFIKGAV